MASQGDNWVRDGHRVTVLVDGDHVQFELICPGGEQCPRGDGVGECWLKTWADNEPWGEFHVGKGTDLSYRSLPAGIEYRPAPDGDGEPEWRFV